MITVEDIQIKVYQLLKEKLKAVKLTGSVSYTRHDFTKEDVIILSKGSEGSSDLCVGSIVVNIHVPDIKHKKKDGSCKDTGRICERLPEAESDTSGI